MKYIAEHLFGLQRGERGTALLLAGHHFLVLLCLYLLKPVRDGLFLTDRGTGELPYVFLLVAVATIPASLFQRWMGRRFRHDRLTNRLTAAHVVLLLGLGGLVYAGVTGAAYAVYVYVSLYGVLATSQFWLFAGGLLDSAQSKRTFAVLNLGGILGAVVGGELTGGLLQLAGISPSLLLFIAGGLLGLTVPLAAWIRRYHARQARNTLPVDADSPASSSARAKGEETAPDDAAEDQRGHADDGLGLVARLRKTVSDFPLVGWIAAIIALMSVVSTMLDYQLKTIAFQAFPGEAELMAFMGRFYGRVSLVALGLQLLLTTGLRRRVQSTSALWLLPVALALGTTALLLLPGLVAVTALRGADQSLKHSVDKTGRELLYVPLPQAVKRRLKVPLDLVVDQGAYGVGGLLLLGLVLGFGLDAVDLGGVVLVLVVMWLGAVFGARRQYLQEFRSNLHDARRRSASSSDEWAHDLPAGDGQAGTAPPAPQPAGQRLSQAAGGRALQDDGPDSPAPTHALARPGRGSRRPASQNQDAAQDQNAALSGWSLFTDRTAPPAKRELALRHGARYLIYGQLLALRTGATPEKPPPDDTALLPAEPVLRARRRQALSELFSVLADWIPDVQQANPDDLRLALEGLLHTSPSVRSDAVSFLDSLLSGTIRRRLVPLLDDPDGHRTLKDAPPLYRFFLRDFLSAKDEAGEATEGEAMPPPPDPAHKLPPSPWAPQAA